MGNTALKISENNLLIKSEKITREDLVQLISGDVLALRIPNFYSKSACDVITQRFLSGNLVSNYINATNIGRIGMSFYEVQNNLNLMEEYYDLAAKNNDILREVFSPYVSPIDVMMIDIQKVWPAGIKIENIHGKNMFVGLSRVVDEGAEILPHQDLLSRDAPDNINARSILTQLAANIYLNMPDVGGELQLWDRTCSDKEYKKLLVDNDYYVPRDRIEAPTLTIKPNQGELILFNPTKFHAVTAALKGPKRVSVSCFMGYRGDFAPLSFWS